MSELSCQRRTISSAAALRAVSAGVDYANKHNIRIVMSVTDIGGAPMALARCDGAFSASGKIATDKAYTASVFGVSTDTLNGAFGDNEVLRNGIASQDNVVLFGGGYPIIENGEVIGGIGASGGSEDDDRACAQAGLAALGLSAE